MNRTARILIILIAALCASWALTTEAASAADYGIGFFEAGDYPAHADFRRYLREQLPALAPSGVTFIYPPSGYKSADWDREACRRMAHELAADTSVDLVVALGPWTVEDLLAAGFNRPIVAALRFDPIAEGLADSLGQPFAPNVTVRIKPGKIASDLNYFNQLKPLQRLGFLFFPCSENDQTLEAFKRLVGPAGIEVVSAQGFDRKGAFAFFKAFHELDNSIDAIYVAPLWGCDNNKIRSFFDEAARAGIAVFSCENGDQCRRGALAAGSFESPRANALFNAWKIARIAAGVPLSELPNVRPDEPGLTVAEEVARQVEVAGPSPRRPDVRRLPGPLPDDIERLTLTDAVQKALMQNQGYLARCETLRAAAERATRARAALLPQVRAAASYYHFDDNAVHNDDRYEADRLRAGVYVEQEIFSLESLRRNQSASLERDISALDQRQAALDLELAVSLAFLDCLRTQQDIAQLAYITDNVRDISQVATLRDLLDLGTAADAIRWETGWLKAWSDEQDVRAEQRIAFALLNGLLGRPGDYPFVLDARGLDDQAFAVEEGRLATLAATPQAEAELIARLIDLAREGSPEIQTAINAVARSNLESMRSAAGFYPTLGLRGGFEYTDEWASYPGFEEKNPSWYVGAKLELPLFLGGKRLKERGALKLELGGLQFERDAITLKLANDVRTETEALLTDIFAFRPAAHAAARSQEYLDLTLADYSVGNRPIADLLDAVENARRSALLAVACQMAGFRSTARLLRLAGIAPHEQGNTPVQELVSRLTQPSTP